MTFPQVPRVEIHAIANKPDVCRKHKTVRVEPPVLQTRSGSIYYELPVRHLDDILSRHFDLIKLDGKGHELAVLQGASKTIEHTNPAILFECTSEYEVGRPAVRRGIYDLLTAARYEIHMLGDYLFDKKADQISRIPAMRALSVSRL
jgi:hypothetical protein